MGKMKKNDNNGKMMKNNENMEKWWEMMKMVENGEMGKNDGFDES